MPVLSALNPLAVLVAAASAFKLGGLRYGPSFLKAWGRAAGTAFVLSLIAALSMALALLLRGVDAMHGAGLGALIGLLCVATSFEVYDTSARKLLTLRRIRGDHRIVQFLLCGRILGA